MRGSDYHLAQSWMAKIVGHLGSSQIWQLSLSLSHSNENDQISWKLPYVLEIQINDSNSNKMTIIDLIPDANVEYDEGLGRIQIKKRISEELEIVIIFPFEFETNINEDFLW